MTNEQDRIGFNIHNKLARITAFGILTVGPMLGCGASDMESEEVAAAKAELQNGGSHDGSHGGGGGGGGPRKPVCDAGDTDVAYNAMPFGVVDCQNPSVGFQATSTREFGDEVVLAGKARKLVSLKVLFTSFACETGSWNNADCATTPGHNFSHPITANFYSVTTCPVPHDGDPCPGPLIASVTSTQVIPFRPSADPVKCQGTQWWNAAAGACQNQISTVLTFNFPLRPTLPDQVIWTVAFNTTSYGELPIGVKGCSTMTGGCPYDSLNVGAKTYTVPPFAGTDFDTSGIYQSSTWPGAYCDGGTGGVGSLRLDLPCWRPNRPLAEITTKK